MVILSDRDPAAEKAENRILLGVDFRTLLAKEPDPAVHQQCAEYVDNPVKAPDEANAQQDKNRTHDQSADNSPEEQDRKSTRLNSSHLVISYAVFCLKKNNI